ncbi:MAG: type II secretory pathway pseudopilin PulG [Myxococcota bacterium]|jgi:type II secretory pathway pseudopilin PulG
MTLLEVIVVIAIALVLTVVMATGINSLFSLNQRSAASQLAITYTLLREEAVLRNQTYRVAYHLDGNYYQVEMGDPNVLIFEDEDQRKEYERQRQSKLTRQTAEEVEADDPLGGFMAIAPFDGERVDLPGGTVFGGVKTPQYNDMVLPSGGEEDEEDPLVVYSYVFPTGFTEPTVIQLVDKDNDRRGFTIIVDAMTGSVRLESEIIDARDAFRDHPDEGPSFPQ